MMQNAIGNRRRGPAWLLVLCLAGLASPAVAQSTRVVAPDRVPAGGDFNLFAGLDERNVFDGAVLAIPTSWQLVEAVLLRENGDLVPLEHRVLGFPPGRYLVAADGPVTRPSEIRVRVRTGDMPTDARWSIVPLDRQVTRGSIRSVPREDLRVTRPIRTERRPYAGANRVLAIDSGRFLELDGRRLPDLGTSSAWTIETWFRSTSVDAALVSTWDGRDESDYPAEIMIDATGRLMFYQGQDGRHRSLRGHQPVADGSWHHVAVTFDPARGWARLLLDGAAVDSLYGFELAGIGRPDRLALGGRPQTPESRFVGELDEFRVWGVARTVATVRAGMDRSLPQPAVGAIVLGFESGIDRSLLVDPSAAPRTQPSDLRFGHPIRDLAARPGRGVVELSWVGDNAEGARYVVERSSDGSRYEAIEYYRNGHGVPEPLSDGRRFSHSDLVPDGRVAFYRVRRIGPTGSEHVTPAIKVGVGDGDVRLNASIEGAYPNPFNPTTTVSYRVDQAGDVSVSIWDLSGQRVRILADSYHQPGLYAVPFTAGELPSGPYFVRLQTAQGLQSHQIVLAK